MNELETWLQRLMAPFVRDFQRSYLMTKEEAKFERHMSRGVLDEFAKALGLGTVQRYKDPPADPPRHPYITRFYGERLTVPQDGWDMIVTITLWLGKFKIDIGRAKWDGGLYETQSLELEYDAADPGFIDDAIRRYHEVRAEGKPE